ncbi:MAG: glycoside hydrolase family 2 TIM barrel-domain containing protein [Candidatus Bathyarchaeia archaeon]
MEIAPRFEREMIDLAGFWHFKIDPENKGEKEEWYKQESFSGWDKIYAPASWNEQDSKYMWYMGTAWYAREFFIPKDWCDRLVMVGFEGVNYITKVWVNGVYLGEHEGGFTPFAFRLENVLKFGAVNQIVVMVNDTLTPKVVPPGGGMNDTYFDFFHYGGIYREAYLLSVPRTHVKDVTIRTDIKGKSGIVCVDLEILNEQEKEWSGALTLAVLDGHEVAAEKQVNLRMVARAEEKFTEKITVRNARFWCPEAPHLYMLRTRLTSEGSGGDTKETRFGIRTVKIEKCRILLNGRSVFLKGCARHEDFPVLGKTFHGAILRKDFGLMKTLGMNSFRTSHYPYSRSHLDLADENGFLVILEMPTAGLRSKVERLDDPEIIERVRKQTREAIQRDKNRPSVIMYSLFNEPDSNREEFRNLLREAIEEARKADPTRPLTFASAKHLDDVALDMVDVQCHNFYYGWYSLSGDLEGAAKVLSGMLEGIHEQYPEAPILITEFGAGAIHGLHKDPPEMWSEEYQAEMIKTYWEVFLSKDYVVGGHIWVFADFKVGQSVRRTTENRKGIFTRTREPKNAVKVVKHLFHNTPTYR